MIQEFTRVRRQVLELCAQQRFSTASSHLVDSGCGIDTYTSLWEYVARRSEAAGNDVVARSIWKELWQAGVCSWDAALRQVDDELRQENFETAEFLLETTFGSDTDNHEARRRLAQAYFGQAELAALEGVRLRTDRARASLLAEDFSFLTPEDSNVLIDLLRYAGELRRALDVTYSARQQFGDDIRFTTREARILEQMNDLPNAALLWNEISNSDEGLRGEALLKLCLLYERLERVDVLKSARAQMCISEISATDRLRLALSTGQTGMVRALTEYVGLDADEQRLPKAVTKSFAEELLDSGYLGLAAWLRRRRVFVGGRAERVLDAMGWSVGGGRKSPETIEEALATRSPDFMFPLEAFLSLPQKPKVSTVVRSKANRILLVNASLGIGGAERQFVQLVRSLVNGGVAQDHLHIAVYSLAPDRGHAHFLPELEALGVTIHRLDDLNDKVLAQPSLSIREQSMIDALPRNLRNQVRLLLPLVKQLKPDVLHGWQDASAAACSIVGAAASVNRIVLSFRNMSPATRRDKVLAQNETLFKEMVARENVMVSANSRIAADDYAGWLGCKNQRIDVIPNAIDVSRYPAAPKLPDTPKGSGKLRIGGIFRLAVNKRPLLWLQTIHALRHEQNIDLKPLLFGTGPLTSEVEDEAETLGLSDLVLRSDVVDPVALYGKIDVLLLMSQVEGLPNVLIEAQAMGKPVAACDVGGVREAVKRSGRGAGLLLGPDVTASDAAAQLARWLPDARTTPPQIFQKFATDNFTSDLLASRTLQTYRGHRVRPS